MTVLWTQSQTLHHPGAKAFDKPVSGFQQPLQNLRVFRVFEIKRDRSLAAVEQILCALARRFGSQFTVNCDDIRTKVSQQHRGKRRRPKRLYFYDSDPRKHGLAPLVPGCPH